MQLIESRTESNVYRVQHPGEHKKPSVKCTETKQIEQTKAAEPITGSKAREWKQFQMTLPIFLSGTHPSGMRCSSNKTNRLLEFRTTT